MDNILLFVIHKIMILSMLGTFQLFGSFSGSKLNWNKSELLPVQASDQTWLNQFPFKIASDTVTYLGIVITKM